MGLIVPDVYKTLLARRIDGESVDIVPATAGIGTGRYNSGTSTLTEPAAGDTGLITPVQTGITVTRTRSGFVLAIKAVLPGSGAAQAITEAAIFTAGGTAVIIASFLPITWQTGVTIELNYSLYPEL